MKSIAKNILLITIITIFLPLLTGEVITYEFDYDFGEIGSMAVVNGKVEISGGVKRFTENLDGVEPSTPFGGQIHEGGVVTHGTQDIVKQVNPDGTVSHVFDFDSPSGATKIDTTYFVHNGAQIYSGPANQSPQFLWQTSDVIISITNDGENVVVLSCSSEGDYQLTTIDAGGTIINTNTLEGSFNDIANLDGITYLVGMDIDYNFGIFTLENDELTLFRQGYYNKITSGQIPCPANNFELEEVITAVGVSTAATIFPDVTLPNTAPTYQTISPTPYPEIHSIPYNGELELTGVATDINGDTLTYAWYHNDELMENETDTVLVIPYGSMIGAGHQIVKQTVSDGNGGEIETTWGVVDNEVRILNNESRIKNYELKQNYPNPFNPVTKIRYQLAVSSEQLAEIVVYNAMGQTVWSTPVGAKNLLPGTAITNNHGYIQFDGSKFNSGIYYYSLVVDGKKMDTKSMILIK